MEDCKVTDKGLPTKQPPAMSKYQVEFLFSGEGKWAQTSEFAPTHFAVT